MADSTGDREGVTFAFGDTRAQGVTFASGDIHAQGYHDPLCE